LTIEYGRFPAKTKAGPSLTSPAAHSPGTEGRFGLCCGMTILSNENADDPSCLARRLIRRCRHAALATSLDHGAFQGHPYASLVATACDTDGNPLLLLSDLAQHSANIKADPRVSLLFDDTASHADPLAGARLSLLGEARPIEDEAARTRFVARHPSAARYTAFADFHLYRVTATCGHLVAGFGRIDWLDGSRLRISATCRRSRKPKRPSSSI
jgi:heme iron utilization protein